MSSNIRFIDALKVGQYKGESGTSGTDFSGSFTGSFTGSGEGDFTGSFTGSFTGDGSGLTGVISDSGSWDGIFTGSARITGSLDLTGSLDIDGSITNGILQISASTISSPGGAPVVINDDLSLNGNRLFGVDDITTIQLTASGNISASGNIIGASITSSGDFLAGENKAFVGSGNDTRLGYSGNKISLESGGDTFITNTEGGIELEDDVKSKMEISSGDIKLYTSGSNLTLTLFKGNITASGNISASGAGTFGGDVTLGGPGEGYRLLASNDGDQNTPIFTDISSVNAGMTIVNDAVYLINSGNAKLTLSGSRFGIGTQTPGESLEVKSAFGQSGNIRATGHISASSFISETHITASGNISASGEGRFQTLGINYNGNLSTGSAGSDVALRVEGNTRINKGYLLVINSASLNEFLYYKNENKALYISTTSSNIGFDPQLIFAQDGVNQAGFGWDDDGEGNIQISNYSTFTASLSPSSSLGGIKFSTSGSGISGAQPKVFISNFGNVGINTTTPGQRLEVSGSISASGFVQSNQINSNQITGSNLAIGTDYNSLPNSGYTGITSRFDGGSYFNIKQEALKTFGIKHEAIGDDILQIDTDPNHFLLDPTGNIELKVGLGVVSPSASLDIAGNIQASSHITASGNISASGTGVNTLGGPLFIEASANDLDLFRVRDTENENNFVVKIDSNQHTEVDLERNGSTKIRLNSYHPQLFNNDNYDPAGGLILGSDFSSTRKSGYGLYVSAGPVSGSIFASSSIYTKSHITASGNISSSGTIIGSLVPQVPKVEYFTVTSSTLVENTEMPLPNSLTYITSSGNYEYLEIFSDGVRLARDVNYTELNTGSVRYLTPIPSQSLITYKSLRLI